ncbi:AMP-binding protein [Variovorax sp. E3]|uniref:AMP-binding protein n=1 Tax=Variovorax sp. E3 TaxID=1914993 RepID=UPI0018DB14F8|nr:AMP-binding protein [Variovorax sp. E3]
MHAKPWHSSYPAELAHDIELPDDANLVSTLEQSFERHRDNDAVSCLGDKLTYARLDEHSRSLTIFLRQLGLSTGDRVALLLPNCLAYQISLAGILRAGMTVVTVNPMYTPCEVEHQLRDAGARSVIVLEALIPRVLKCLPNAAVEHIITAQILGAPGSTGRAFPSDTQATGTTKLQPVPLDIALAVGAASLFEPVRLRPTDISFLKYTGGTTGVSKGAILTHRNMTASLAQMLSWTRLHLRDQMSSTVSPLPPYHIYPLAVTIATMALGFENRLIPDLRDTGIRDSGAPPPALRDADRGQHALRFAGGSPGPCQSGFLRDAPCGWRRRIGTARSSGAPRTRCRATSR